MLPVLVQTKTCATSTISILQHLIIIIADPHIHNGVNTSNDCAAIGARSGLIRLGGRFYHHGFDDAIQSRHPEPRRYDECCWNVQRLSTGYIHLVLFRNAPADIHVPSWTGQHPRFFLGQQRQWKQRKRQWKQW